MAATHFVLLEVTGKFRAMYLSMLGLSGDIPGVHGESARGTCIPLKWDGIVGELSWVKSVEPVTYARYREGLPGAKSYPL